MSGQFLVEKWTTKSTRKEFTCLFDLCRILDSVAICLALSQTEDFESEWMTIEGYRHWEGRSQFEIGEADSLVERGFRLVGKCRDKTMRKPGLVRAVGSIER